MINFLSNWIEQIAISVIIVSVFELILPNGNLKKYIKIVLGVYVVFCIISPFVNRTELYQIGDIDLEQYVQNTTTNQTNHNQESMDLRLQELYMEQLEEDIGKKVEETGYQMEKCKIDANLSSSSDNPGIHKIELIIRSKQKISSIEKVEIGSNNQELTQENEAIVFQLKENLAKDYEVSQDVITIKLK